MQVTINSTITAIGNKTFITIKYPSVWQYPVIYVYNNMILSFIVFIFHFRDCMVTSVVNSLTSFFSGFVIFTYLGYMAKYQDRKIENVAEQGSFIVCGISIFIYIQKNGEQLG